MKGFQFIFFFLFFPLFLLEGQVTEREKFIQLNGIITDSDTNPIPHVSLVSRKLRKGTLSELNGIYSLISSPGDTIYIGALGYKKLEIFIPQNIEGRQFKKDITLEPDTLVIDEVTILPWRSYDDFKRDVLRDINEKSSNPETENMYFNLASIQYNIHNTIGVRASPEAGFRYAMQQNANATMTRGQYPVNNLLNPFAWAKLLSGVKNGLLKNQKISQYTGKMTKPKKKKPSNN